MHTSKEKDKHIVHQLQEMVLDERRKNPKGRQGHVMLCRTCNNDEHFAAKCPRGKGHGRGASASSGPTFYTGLAAVTNPTSSFIDNIQMNNTQQGTAGATTRLNPPWMQTTFSVFSDDDPMENQTEEVQPPYQQQMPPAPKQPSDNDQLFIISRHTFHLT